MIKSLTVVNHLGEAVKIVLTDSEPEHGLLITNIDGLGPAKANINMSDLAISDGSIYNSSRLDSRNVVITFAFLDDVEVSRHNTYKYFPIKKYVVLVVETDRNTLVTEGYVESNEPNIFSDSEGCSISIICPDPYMYSLENNLEIISSVKPLFEFPYSAGMPVEEQEKIISRLPSDFSLFSAVLTKHDNEQQDDTIVKTGSEIDSFIKVLRRPSDIFGYPIVDAEGNEVLDRDDNPITGAVYYKRYDIEADIINPYCKVVRPIVSTEDNVTTITFEIIDDFDPLIEFGTYKDPIVEFDYQGSCDTGCVLTLYFNSTVKDSIDIYNDASNTGMRIDIDKIMRTVDSYFLSGDEVIIDTNNNNKSIYLVRDGVYTNILNCLTRPYKWITIVNGHNSIYYSTSRQYLSSISGSISYKTCFEGI